MLLIGMLDSPFVRRVAVSMRLLDIGYEHANWSIGKDFERIRHYSPLGRVPTLVLDDGEVLSESAIILDYLDERVGAARALLPPAGAARRAALQQVALAMGAADKGRDQVYEQVFRPADKRHPPWVERCRTQMQGALGAIEHACDARGAAPWLIGDAIGQADISVTCAFTFLREALRLSDAASAYPRLWALAGRCEALPAFRATHLPFVAPGGP